MSSTDPETPVPSPSVAPARASGPTIAGFVVSIVALLLSFLGGGVIPAIVAIVLLIIGNRRGRTTLGVAGSVLSVLAIVISVIVVIARIQATGSGTL